MCGYKTKCEYAGGDSSEGESGNDEPRNCKAIIASLTRYPASIPTPLSKGLQGVLEGWRPERNLSCNTGDLQHIIEQLHRWFPKVVLR